MVYRAEPRKGSKRLNKLPIDPRTGHSTDYTDQANWLTFDQAVEAASRWSGIGIVITPNLGIVGVDLDELNMAGDGSLPPGPAGIVARLDSYSELSVSGTGLHVLAKAQLPATGRKRQDLHVEMYDGTPAPRFLVVTGNHVAGTPSEIAPRQAEIDSLHLQVFGKQQAKQPKNVVQLRSDQGGLLTDTEIRTKATRSKGGLRWRKLYELGDWSDYGSQSEADLALCNLLAFWTGCDVVQMERMFRASALYRDKDDQHPTYLVGTIQKAIKDCTKTYSAPRQVVKQALRIKHPHKWQRETTTEEARAAEMRLAVEATHAPFRERVAISQAGKVHVVLCPPGSGKTYSYSALGAKSTTNPYGEIPMAWITPYHALATNGSLQHFDHYYGVNEKNCHKHERGKELARKGYNTYLMHEAHDCVYFQQFRKHTGSTIYPVAALGMVNWDTVQAVVIDEFDLANWIDTKKYGIEELKHATPGDESYQSRLLRAAQAVISDAMANGKVYQGRALFDALDSHMEGQLAIILPALHQDDGLMNPRPYTDAEDPSMLPMVILPGLVRALFAELTRWTAGGADWNGRVRVDGDKLTISTKRELPKNKPITILDATGDELVFSLYFGMPVEIERVDFNPMPGTQHIAVRELKNGKSVRNGIMSVVKSPYASRKQATILKKLRHLLRDAGVSLDMLRSGAVGIISYKDCVQELGEALSIPADKCGWFGNMRGSNALESCEVLLVVGTFAPNPSDVARLARLLYFEDPNPIDETYQGGYVDPRMQHLADYLSQAEMTQVSHRNRALRHDNRLVITMCSGEIGYLPATETVHGFPEVLDTKGSYQSKAKTGDAMERIARAEAELVAINGGMPSMDTLAAAAHVSKRSVMEYRTARGRTTAATAV